MSHFSKILNAFQWFFGTHDSMATIGLPVIDQWVLTQSLSLEKQLNAGIRFLDIRCVVYGIPGVDPEELCRLHHGPHPIPGTLNTVMNTVKTFLQSNPGEMIHMRLKEESTMGVITPNATKFLNSVNQMFKTYGSIMWKPVKEWTIPKLGEIRGKVVLQADFPGGEKYGLPRSGRIYDEQDEWDFAAQDDLYNKWIHVKNHLRKTHFDKKKDKISINYLTANGLRLRPFFVASGHISRGTGSPNNPTGLNTQFHPDSFPDFPRWACIFGFCQIYYEGTNILTYEKIRAERYPHVGIIVADFPGPGLLQTVVARNYMSAVALDDSPACRSQTSCKLNTCQASCKKTDINKKIPWTDWLLSSLSPVSLKLNPVKENLTSKSNIKSINKFETIQIKNVLTTSDLHVYCRDSLNKTVLPEKIIIPNQTADISVGSSTKLSCRITSDVNKEHFWLTVFDKGLQVINQKWCIGDQEITDCKERKYFVFDTVIKSGFILYTNNATTEDKLEANECLNMKESEFGYLLIVFNFGCVKIHSEEDCKGNSEIYKGNEKEEEAFLLNFFKPLKSVSGC